MKAMGGRTAVVAAMVGLALPVVGCQDVYLTAPPGATIDLSANPSFVASHGGPAGSSELTAFVMEAAGTPVADGTVVFCTTDLGRVDREVRTRNGFARARFESDARSGTANVRCFSGGGAGGSGTTTTTTVSTALPPGAASRAPERLPSGASASGVAGGLVAAGTAVASLAAAPQAEATVSIQVGSIRVRRVHLRANPPRIPVNSNSTHVTAAVFDEFGNPVEGVPVFFEVTTGSTEFFELTGPVFTNNNGEAENILRTRRTTPGTAVVRARAVGPGTFVDSDPLSIPVL